MICFDQLGYRGRLGNALYQLASMIGIGDRLGEAVRLNADWIHRPYFSVPDDLFGPSEGTPVADVLDKELEPGRTSQWLKDFLQNYSWFAESMPKIERFLHPSNDAQAILYGGAYDEFFALPQPVLSVHVRRGDNVVDPGVPDKHLYWPVPTRQYYADAIAMLRPAARSVAVFSDDPVWCIENLPGDYFQVGVPRPKEHERDYFTAPVLDWIDLQLMALCEGPHICSNSTFGWWGAMLSCTDFVVYPWPIVGPKLPEVKMEMAIPPTWQAIVYR